MEEWKRLVKETITKPERLAQILEVDVEAIKRVHKEFPLRVNPYYLSLIQEKGDPIWKQIIPDVHEITSDGFEDPLAEEEDSPICAPCRAGQEAEEKK